MKPLEFLEPRNACATLLLLDCIPVDRKKNSDLAMALSCQHGCYRVLQVKRFQELPQRSPEIKNCLMCAGEDRRKWGGGGATKAASNKISARPRIEHFLKCVTPVRIIGNFRLLRFTRWLCPSNVRSWTRVPLGSRERNNPFRVILTLP